MTLVIFGSAKKNGFTGLLLQRELSQNREKYPGPVRFFYCFEHFIAPCSGCGECSQTGRCRHGDLAAFHRDFLAATQLVFAFPVYNGSVPAPLKALLDRFRQNALHSVCVLVRFCSVLFCLVLFCICVTYAVVTRDMPQLLPTLLLPQARLFALEFPLLQ